MPPGRVAAIINKPVSAGFFLEHMKVTLKALAPVDSRLRSIPDMVPGNQVEWSDSRVKVYPDGSFSVPADVGSFQFRVRHKRWGRWASVGVS